MSTPPFDVVRAHRWFAVELSNLAWDLIDADPASPAELEQMIHAAHAACFHWLKAGDLLNHLRAHCLLATAYVKASLPESAVRHAERCLALSQEAGDRQTPFDRATAHGCAAAAYHLAGQIDCARNEHALARVAADTLADPADRAVFERLFPEP